MKIQAMRSNGLVFALFITLAVVLSMARTEPVYAAATTFTASSIFPINTTVFVPCAAGGAGEDVALSGSLHDLFSVTLDDNGGVRLTFEDNLGGVTGTGLVTGDKYQGTGVNRFGLNRTSGGTIVENFVDTFSFIGQGSGNNFLLHENVHFTVSPDFTIISFHDNFSVECK